MSVCQKCHVAARRLDEARSILEVERALALCGDNNSNVCRPVRCRFNIFREWYPHHTFDVSLPACLLSDGTWREMLGRRLAVSLYSRLVTEGGRQVVVDAGNRERNLFLVNVVSAALYKDMPRAQFYSHFGDPVTFSHGPIPQTQSGLNPNRTIGPVPGEPMTAIGLDIGGTRLKVVSLQNGRVRRAYSIDVDKTSASALSAQVTRVIGAEFSATTKQQKMVPRGIGVAVAGVLKGQRMVRLTNFERFWAKVQFPEHPLDQISPDLFRDGYAVLNDLPTVLRARFGIPVALINDANAFGCAELASGSAGCSEDTVLFTIGTGVGYVKLSGGCIEDISHQGGHMIVRVPQASEAVDPGCGHSGCLAAYASAAALKRGAGECSPNPEGCAEATAQVNVAAEALAIAIIQLLRILPRLRRVVLAGAIVNGNIGASIVDVIRQRLDAATSAVSVSLSHADCEWGGAIGAAYYSGWASSLSGCSDFAA
jgi:predicted NBD/HSP70 family sugar kinase